MLTRCVAVRRTHGQHYHHVRSLNSSPLPLLMGQHEGELQQCWALHAGAGEAVVEPGTGGLAELEMGNFWQWEHWFAWGDPTCCCSAVHLCTAWHCSGWWADALCFAPPHPACPDMGLSRSALYNACICGFFVIWHRALSFKARLLMLHSHVNSQVLLSLHPLHPFWPSPSR